MNAPANVPPTHRLVTALVPDPRQPPDLRAFRGYLGPSDDPACTRLYLDARMSTWLDIATGQVMHIERIAPYGDFPLGEDVVWVARRTARRLTREMAADDAEAEFAQQGELAVPVAPGAVSRGRLQTIATPAATCPCQADQSDRGDAAVQRRQFADGPNYGGGYNSLPWPP